jgi:hypothetical protein
MILQNAVKAIYESFLRRIYRSFSKLNAYKQLAGRNNMNKKIVRAVALVLAGLLAAGVFTGVISILTR